MGSGWIGVSVVVGCANIVTLAALSRLWILRELMLYEWVGGIHWGIDCEGAML